jgi:hypothetical protein
MSKPINKGAGAIDMLGLRVSKNSLHAVKLENTGREINKNVKIKKKRLIRNPFAGIIRIKFKGRLI